MMHRYISHSSIGANEPFTVRFSAVTVDNGLFILMNYVIFIADITRVCQSWIDLPEDLNLVGIGQQLRNNLLLEVFIQ